MRSIYVFFGMIASGKSTLARQFAARQRLSYYNTDRVRKELAGLAPTSRRTEGINQGIYSDEFSRATYREMLKRAGNDLAGGCPGVVLDGSYHRRQERENVRQAAAESGAICNFIQCRCRDEEVMRRLERRSRDPESVSDGRWEIYLAQKESFEAPDELSSVELVVLDTENEVELLLDKLEAELDLKKT